MKTLTLNLTNDFHNSETTICAKARPDGTWIVSRRAWDDACRRLCGMSDCDCGSVRGPMTDNDGRRYTAIDLLDDGVVIER